MKLAFHHPDEAIAALITPPGEGGVAIVRLSGERSILIARDLCARPLSSCQSHRLYRCGFFDANQGPIDEGLVVVMWAPRSYTGELSIEFHLHGNPLIAHLLLQALVVKGAKLALPGEFTYRAFARGKLDLAQAEGLADLISAKSEQALEIAKSQLEGRLSESIARLRAELTEIAAHLEAALDFPDEGLQVARPEQLLSSLARVRAQLSTLAASLDQGQLARRGWSICLIGRPNVGKSSLLNALLGQDRAIVTPEAGTTRDTLEGIIRLEGRHARILDTAGLRATAGNAIEEEGMRRSRQALARADLALWVLDASSGWNSEDGVLAGLIDPAKTLIVWNKIDLARSQSRPELSAALGQSAVSGAARRLLTESKSALVSARTLSGIDRLKAAAHEQLTRLSIGQNDGVVLTSHRHQLALLGADGALAEAQQRLQGSGFAELAAGDVRLAIQQLDGILGGDVTEDVLAALFANFCLGK